MKDLNFLAGKDITWIENNFEPTPKDYLFNKDDVIIDMGKMRTAKRDSEAFSYNKFAFFTNLSTTEGYYTNRTSARYNYDIYDVKFDKNGKLMGFDRESQTDVKYPSLHSRYEYTLHHRNFYRLKQSTTEFMNWPNKKIEGL